MKQSTYSSYGSTVAWVKRGLLLSVFGGFGFLIWYAADNREDLQTEASEVPLINAEQGAVKVRAENPGGMEVPNRDKKVFDLLADSKIVDESLNNANPCDKNGADFACGKEAPKVEEIAAVQVVKPVQDIVKPVDDISSIISSTEIVKKQGGKLIQPIKTTAKNSVVNVKPKVKIKPTAVKKEAPIVAKSTGGFGVQLGSYGSASGADKASGIHRKKLGSLLDGLTYSYQKADVKGKSYYRVRFMGLKTKSEAQGLCKKIKAKKQGCWYAKG